MLDVFYLILIFLTVHIVVFFFFFFFNDTATTEIYTLSLHDALPICWGRVTGCTCWASTSAVPGVLRKWPIRSVVSSRTTGTPGDSWSRCWRTWSTASHRDLPDDHRQDEGARDPGQPRGALAL